MQGVYSGPTKVLYKIHVILAGQHMSNCLDFYGW